MKLKSTPEILDNRSELMAVALAMIGGHIHLIEGLRKICTLRYDIDELNNDVFNPICGMESETDHFPLGEVRKYCDASYLQKMDEDLRHYLDDAKDDIIKACKDIVEEFS